MSFKLICSFLLLARICSALAASVGNCPPLFIEHGAAVCNNGDSYHSTCDVICFGDHVLVGRSNVTCEIDENEVFRWDSLQLPYCTDPNVPLKSTLYNIRNIAVVSLMVIVGMYLLWMCVGSAYNDRHHILQYLSAIWRRIRTQIRSMLGIAAESEEHDVEVGCRLNASFVDDSTDGERSAESREHEAGEAGERPNEEEGGEQAAAEVKNDEAAEDVEAKLLEEKESA